MSKSLIQVVNQSDQNVAVNSIIGLGSVQRRYGCNLKLSGNAIEAVGPGYYEVDASISISPTAVGNVTVALYDNGVQVPGAIAYDSVSTATNPVSLGITATVRQGCCADADSITLVLIEGAGTVNNVSMRVVKS